MFDELLGLTSSYYFALRSFCIVALSCPASMHKVRYLSTSSCHEFILVTMNYKGDIIEESLADKATLKNVNIIATRVETVTPDHKTPWLRQWTLHAIDVPEDNAATVAENLSHTIETEHSNWYIDFKNETTHYVIFPGKIFKVNRSRPEEYKPVVSYGAKHGIPRHQLDLSPEIAYWER